MQTSSYIISCEQKRRRNRGGGEGEEKKGKKRKKKEGGRGGGERGKGKKEGKRGRGKGKRKKKSRNPTEISILYNLSAYTFECHERLWLSQIKNVNKEAREGISKRGNSN